MGANTERVLAAVAVIAKDLNDGRESPLFKPEHHRFGHGSSMLSPIIVHMVQREKYRLRFTAAAATPTIGFKRFGPQRRVPQSRLGLRGLFVLIPVHLQAHDAPRRVAVSSFGSHASVVELLQRLRSRAFRAAPHTGFYRYLALSSDRSTHISASAFCCARRQARQAISPLFAEFTYRAEIFAASTPPCTVRPNRPALRLDSTSTAPSLLPLHIAWLAISPVAGWGGLMWQEICNWRKQAACWTPKRTWWAFWAVSRHNTNISQNSSNAVK